jgi:hypothetical protein
VCYNCSTYVLSDSSNTLAGISSSSPCEGGDIVLAVVVVTGTDVVETDLGVVVDVVVRAVVGAVVGTPLEGEVAAEFKLLFR